MPAIKAYYDHEILHVLCKESNISVAELSESDNLVSDVYNDLTCIKAVRQRRRDTAPEYLTRVCDTAMAGDVAATLALRRLFGLPPIA